MKKARQTQRQKLHAALAETAAARANDPLPDTAVERRFRKWSEALHAVVGERLNVDYWVVTEWSNNPDCNDARVFYFRYEGREEPVQGRPMFVSVPMRLDTGKDLEAELVRLAEEARWYRERADQLWRGPEVAS
jgi:hypothetical protein